MKSYPHHIGDFNKKTRHLNRLERSIYRDLLDLYYEVEQQLTLHVPTICRLILAHTPEEATVVERSLSEFFVQTPDGWYHDRCEEEIDRYRANNTQKALAGKASAAKRAAKRQRALNGNPTDVETPLKRRTTALQQTVNGTSTNLNLKPRTKNQEPVKEIGAVAPRQQLDYSCWPSMPEPQTLADWIAMRKRLKADVSQTVINQFGKELHLANAAGYSVDRCIAECVTSKWQGFKFSWITNREASNGPHQQNARRSKSEQNADAFLEHIAALDRQGQAGGDGLAGFIESQIGDGTGG